MTINQLIKQLVKLRDEHGKTIRICADTNSLRRSCNDTWSVIDVSEAEFEVIELVDGDGFKEYRKDGTERMQRCIVLR
jgi:hypothetical protein